MAPTPYVANLPTEYQKATGANNAQDGRGTQIRLHRHHTGCGAARLSHSEKTAKKKEAGTPLNLLPRSPSARHTKLRTNPSPHPGTLALVEKLDGVMPVVHILLVFSSLYCVIRLLGGYGRRFRGRCWERTRTGEVGSGSQERSWRRVYESGGKGRMRRGGRRRWRLRSRWTLKAITPHAPNHPRRFIRPRYRLRLRPTFPLLAC